MLTFYEFRKARATAFNEGKERQKNLEREVARRSKPHSGKSVKNLDRVEQELKKESNNEDLGKRLDTVERE